jgi:uncharacterized protein YbjT (DUF2867 family)
MTATQAASQRVLVAGATGMLGGVIVRKLLMSRVPVRAIGRNREKLQQLEALGAETMVGDLLVPTVARRACRDVDQVCATANNVMGAGVNSPNRVDLPAYRNLCDAAKQEGVRRLVYVSARNTGPDSILDFFRLKRQLEGVVRDSGVPYVIVRPSAYMDVWAGVLFGDGEVKHPTATLFGDGRRIRNFIAVDDVADFVVAILASGDVCNEIVDIGGPSNVSLADFATLVERALAVPVKRRHIPVPVMRIGRLLLRPFNERVSRMMTMGYWSTLEDLPYDDWTIAARRFGLAPRSLEAFVAERYQPRR